MANIIYREITDIIGDFIQKELTNLKSEVKAVEDLGDDCYKLSLPDVYWLQGSDDPEASWQVTVNGSVYKLKVVEDCSITVEGSPAPSVGDLVDIPNPFYIFGTPRRANQETVNQLDSNQYTPMIYLLETLRERYFQDVTSSIERASTLRLFFLTQVNLEDWNTKQFHDLAIKSVKRMAHRFIEKLDQYPSVRRIENYDLVAHSSFGTFITRNGFNNGYEATVFDDKLGGVEMTFTLELFKTSDCKACC